LLRPTNYVIAVEHDLSVLDYLSDFICVLYGMPAAYGVVTMPFSVREGINHFLDGMIPTENLRFRDESLTFKLVETADEVVSDKMRRYQYPDMIKDMGVFVIVVSLRDYSVDLVLFLFRRFPPDCSGRRIYRLGDYCFAGRERHWKDDLYSDACRSAQAGQRGGDSGNARLLQTPKDLAQVRGYRTHALHKEDQVNVHAPAIQHGRGQTASD
jgi:hypothetical protein